MVICCVPLPRAVMFIVGAQEIFVKCIKDTSVGFGQTCLGADTRASPSTLCSSHCHLLESCDNAGLDSGGLGWDLRCCTSSQPPGGIQTLSSKVLKHRFSHL